MTEALFKVVFTGELLPGFTADTVKENLAKLFKSDIEKIDALFTGKQVVLKRELKDADADKYLAALRSTGALARKESDLAAHLSLVATEGHDKKALPAAAQSATRGVMTCPKCGHEQAKSAECAACGVIIEKFIARQALLPKVEVVVASAAEASEPDAAAVPATASSPYTPPLASVTENLPEFGELKVFTTQGRVGRLRYMAWSFSLGLLVAAAVILSIAGYAITPALGFLLGGVATIGLIVAGVMIGVQRLHDVGWSGWLLLLTIVPILGFVFYLLMLFMPGAIAANRYGAPPPENSTSVKVLAGLFILGQVLALYFSFISPDLQQYLPSQQ